MDLASKNAGSGLRVAQLRQTRTRELHGPRGTRSRHPGNDQDRGQESSTFRVAKPAKDGILGYLALPLWRTLRLPVCPEKGRPFSRLQGDGRQAGQPSAPSHRRSAIVDGFVLPSPEDPRTGCFAFGRAEPRPS